MKSVSALILVCAIACASAQFAVKGGASGSSGTVRAFFPFRPFVRSGPGSIQEKKEQLQLANVDVVVGGSSDFGSGGAGSVGNGFVKQTVDTVSVPVTSTVVETQPQVRPFQPVTYVSSGSVEPQTQSFIQSFVPQSASAFEYLAPVTQSFQQVVPSSQQVVSQVGSVVAPAVQSTFVPAVQSTFTPAVQSTFTPAVQSTFTPAVQSVQSAFAPLNKVYQPSGYFYENRQPSSQLVQFGGPSSTVQSFPSYAQNIVHYANVQQPQPQVATVQTVPSFSAKSFGSESYFPTVVSKQVVKQVAPTFVSQPAPFPSVTNVVVPSSGSHHHEASHGQILTDNKISPSFGTIQQQPTVFSQEKQSGETVQSTEW